MDTNKTEHDEVQTPPTTSADTSTVPEQTEGPVLLPDHALQIIPGALS